MESNEAIASAFGSVDTLWVLIAAAMVFFMQAGFKVLETGLVKSEHRTGISVKNIMDWIAGSLAFFVVGFGIMFGSSAEGLFGTDHFLGYDFNTDYDFVFFVFQLAFAGTALTIVSGAMSGRTALLPYFIASFFTAIFIYPMFGHWAWGNLLDGNNKAWLADLGFMDFAGSTVVHSVGAWVGLVGIWMVGPRLGRFSSKGAVQPMKSSDYSYSMLGLMILWFGWWGFNGGSTLAFNGDVAKIILNTNLAASMACLVAYLHAKFIQKGDDAVEKIIGGALTGLVAITACCNVVTPLSSIIIGILAGLVHNYSYVLIIHKWKLDDPVGAIPVHGFGGMLGTLCVALFGQADLLVHGRWTQLAVQIFGILVCLTFTIGTAYAMFFLVKYFFGLRLSPKAEQYGEVFDKADKTKELDELPEQAVTQVSVRISDRAYNLFSVKDYLNLPRETRMNLVKSRGVEYLDDYGNSVSPLQAVRYLSGLVENQRDEALTEKEIYESTSTKLQSDVVGNLQDALLGEESSIVSVFPDSFVMLKHKKSVSGDFYWYAKEKGYQIVAVASCQDGSIPSAFVSAICISLLNEIVGIKKVLPPEKVLTILDQKLTVALSQSGKSAEPIRGVEMAIMLVNTDLNKAYYASSGSYLKIYHAKKSGDMAEYKGLDIPLGKMGEETKNFERKKLVYEHGDALYICTKGFSNQLNKNGKRFSSTALKELIRQNARKSMLEQKMIFDRAFDEWRGGHELVEDVLVVGLKP